MARLRTAFTPAPKRSTVSRFQHTLGRCRPSMVGALAATVLALGMGAAAPAWAQAMTENFDALSCANTGTPIPVGTGGLDWGTGYCARSSGNGASGLDAGTISAPNAAYNGYGTAMALTRNGGGIFALQTGQFTAWVLDNRDLQIQGFANGTLMATVNATLRMGAPTLVDLSPLVNVDRVVFTMGTWFILDDLSYKLVVSHAITATASPSAGGSVSCTPNPVVDGGTSICTATANTGYALTGFAGCTSVSGNTCTSANVTAPAAVTANFAAFTVAGSLPPGTYGTAYSQPLASTGGVDPIGYASSNPPAGITVTPAGLVTALATLAAGAYTFDVTATDANNAATIATPYTLTIAQAAQTIAFTSANPAGAKLGDSYTVTATGGASGNPVTFSLGADAAPFCSISGNVVSFNASGPCDIIASQLGDANYLDAAPVTQTVTVAPGASGVNIASTPNPSQPGEAVTFTVSVALDTTKGAAVRTKAAAEPTGTVTVTASDTGTVLGSAPLVNGTATISTQLLTTAGSHAIVASYSGDANYPATTSLAFTQTVAAAAAPVATPVPTLSEWALIGLSAVLALFGAGRMRRRAA